MEVTNASNPVDNTNSLCIIVNNSISKIKLIVDKTGHRFDNRQNSRRTDAYRNQPESDLELRYLVGELQRMSVTDQAGSAGDSLGSPLVADQLKMDIWSGRLPDGVRLTEADVSKKFDVSRGQAREALQRLAVQGLIRSRPNCGAIVAPAAPLPIRRLIIPIRRTIESFALDMVFEDLNDEDFSRWQENLAKMKVACEQRDFFAIAELDIAFHRQIVDRCNQPDLSQIWETLVSRIRSHFQKVQRRCKDVMDIYREHCLLIDTFRDGTRAEALKLLKAKID